MNLQQLQAKFPRIKQGNYRYSSPVDIYYNCIAWAAGENDVWWEPDGAYGYFWPLQAERVYTIAAYMQAFGTKGFVPCDSPSVEQGFVKVALYALKNFPTHASRQVSDGWWASKLGQNIDIEHELDALNGGEYGSVVYYLRKQV